LKNVIKFGAELDANISIRNPLFTAISKGNHEIVKILIEAGIDLTPVYKTKDKPW